MQVGQNGVNVLNQAGDAQVAYNRMMSGAYGSDLAAPAPSRALEEIAARLASACQTAERIAADLNLIADRAFGALPCAAPEGGEAGSGTVAYMLSLLSRLDAALADQSRMSERLATLV